MPRKKIDMNVKTEKIVATPYVFVAGDGVEKTEAQANEAKIYARIDNAVDTAEERARQLHGDNAAAVAGDDYEALLAFERTAKVIDEHIREQRQIVTNALGNFYRGMCLRRRWKIGVSPKGKDVYNVRLFYVLGADVARWETMPIRGISVSVERWTDGPEGAERDFSSVSFTNGATINAEDVGVWDVISATEFDRELAACLEEASGHNTDERGLLKQLDWRSKLSGQVHEEEAETAREIREKEALAKDEADKKAVLKTLHKMSGVKRKAKKARKTRTTVRVEEAKSDNA